MSTHKLTFVFVALFVFLIAWSVGLAAPLMDWLNPSSEMERYLINKGVLTLVFAAVLWRMRLCASVGFTSGTGLSTYVIGLPLIALGILAFFEPGRAALTAPEIAGWTVVVIFVAFTEETLFRGILWQALSASNVWKRAFTTSFLFGLSHSIAAFGVFGWSMAGIYGLSAAGFGMVFAAMRERAGTIWSVIIVHAVFDMAAISASGGVDALLEPELETYIGFALAATIFTAWGSAAIYLMQRRARREGAPSASANHSAQPAPSQQPS